MMQKPSPKPLETTNDLSNGSDMPIHQQPLLYHQVNIRQHLGIASVHPLGETNDDVLYADGGGYLLKEPWLGHVPVILPHETVSFRNDKEVCNEVFNHDFGGLCEHLHFYN